MQRTARLHRVMDDHGRPVLDDAHPTTAEAVGGQEPRGFESSHAPGDEGLLLVAPCRPWTDPHGHQPFTAALAGEKPLLESVTTVVRVADASAMAGEGVRCD